MASHGNFRIVRVGVPIQIMGMPIQTGSLLHGDENLLVQVPVECLTELPVAVGRIRRAKHEMMEHVRSPIWRRYLAAPFIRAESTQDP